MDLLNEIEANLRLVDKRIVALWGMGCVGCELRRQIIDSKLTIKLECIDKYNENYSDIDLLEQGKSKYFVVITFVKGYEDAAKTLVDMGYEEVKDFICLGKYSKISAKYANDNRVNNRIMVRNDTIETRKMAYDDIDNKCGLESYKRYFDYARYRSFELLVRDIRDEYSNEELGNMACAEAGVFKGDFAWIINKNFPECQLYLYDTFEGFEDKDIEIDIDNKYMTKTYMERIKDYFADNENTADSRMNIVKNKCPNKELINFRKGYFPDTTEGEKNYKWVFVSLDMDLYQPTLEGILFFYPNLVRSGGMFVHDYNNKEFFGVREAIKEAERRLGVHIPRMPITDEGGTVVLLK